MPDGAVGGDCGWGFITAKHAKQRESPPPPRINHGNTETHGKVRPEPVTPGRQRCWLKETGTSTAALSDLVGGG